MEPLLLIVVVIALVGAVVMISQKNTGKREAAGRAERRLLLSDAVDPTAAGEQLAGVDADDGAPTAAAAWRAASVAGAWMRARGPAPSVRGSPCGWFRLRVAQASENGPKPMWRLVSAPIST